MTAPMSPHERRYRLTDIMLQLVHDNPLLPTSMALAIAEARLALEDDDAQYDYLYEERGR